MFCKNLNAFPLKKQTANLISKCIHRIPLNFVYLLADIIRRQNLKYLTFEIITADTAACVTDQNAQRSGDNWSGRQKDCTIPFPYLTCG